MSRQERVQCPDQFELAAYMADMLTDEEREHMERHLLQCEHCHNKIRDMARINATDSDLAEAVSLPRAWARAEKLLAQWQENDQNPVQPSLERQVLILYPIVRSLPPEAFDRLAATTEESEPSTSVSYASEDGSVIAKLLRDDRSDELHLYLMAESMELVQDAYVKVFGPEGRLEREGLPNQHGVFDLSGLPAFDPATVHVELLLPELTIRLDPQELSDHLVGENSVELESSNDRSLVIDVVDHGAHREYKLDLSDLRSEHPKCSIKVYATAKDKTTEVTVGPEGIALIKQPETDHLLIRAYIL